MWSATRISRVPGNSTTNNNNTNSSYLLAANLFPNNTLSFVFIPQPHHGVKVFVKSEMGPLQALFVIHVKYLNTEKTFPHFKVLLIVKSPKCVQVE